MRRPLAALVTSVLVLGGLAATASPARADWAPADPSDPRTPPTVTADALETVQINGVVWSQAVAGDTVYAGGSFTEARPPGAAVGTGQPRGNLVAFDVATGEMTDFAPALNQQIRAVAVAGDRLYVGGEFTQVDGQARSRIAAFDLTTGDLVEDFDPQVNGTVQAIAVTAGAVYVGGSFGGVGNQDRGNLAAFDLAGNLLAWAPRVGGGAVTAMTANPDGSSIAVGGTFLTVNGDAGQDDDPDAAEPGDGLALLDATSGAARPLPAGLHLYNGNGAGEADGGITALAADAGAFYGAGYTYSSIDAGTIEGVFAVNWSDGSIKWVADCHGDSYSVHPQGDLVYAANHSHYCENIGGVTQGAGGVGDYPYYRAVAFSKRATGTATWEPDNRRYHNFEGQPSPSLQTWFPSINVGSFTGQSQGSWSVTGNEDYIVMGGEFTRVNGQNQQGLVRFARADLAPQQEGPTLFNNTYPIQVHSTEAGKVRISWRSNEDIDNANLEYRVYRDTTAAANRIATRTVRADFWNPLGMTATDTVVPGSTHQYRVEVRDPSGNVANSSWTTVTAAATGPASAYLEAVHGDEPTHWWRFGESEGSAADAVGSNPLTVGAAVARGTAGAVPSDAESSAGNRGATFTGTPAANSVATSTVQDSPPDLFTLEAWFRTTATTGGRLVGRDNGASRNAKVDRLLYLDAAGHVAFDVKPDENRATLATPGTYNDGQWHHVAGVLSPGGMELYVDGQLTRTRADVTVGEHLAIGYWKVGGGGAVTGLPGSFTGAIDEVAVYKRALSATEIAQHVAAAGQVTTPQNRPPTASFTEQVTGLGASFTSTSTDPDGTIDSYLWQFGDGATSTEPSSSHTYANAGTYDVTLTVIDDGGEQATATRALTVTDPDNQAPTASFTLQQPLETGLRPRFDATASADPDGTITRWLWDFGNGRTSTQAAGRADYRTASGPGTYVVSLTVTDNDGATHKVAQSVTVTEAGTPVLGDPPPNQPPTASFTATTNRLTAAFDATASDPDGSIAAYAWAFGDGSTSAVPDPSHTYAAAGTYPVQLTVTDDAGATFALSQSVTVLAGTTTPPPGTRPPLPPRVTKVATRTGLRVQVPRARPATRAVQVRRGRKLVLVAAVRPVATATLTGSVRLLDQGRVLRVVRIGGTGPRTVRLVVRKLPVGRHRLRVVYSGSPTTLGSRSAVVVVRVVRRS